MRGAQPGDDLGGMAVEQGALGARDAIPGQAADRFEQAGAQRVVEIFRLQLLGRQREIARDVGRELRLEGRRRARLNPRPFETWRRHKDSCRETSCGSWGAPARAPWRGTPPS